jgi:hypothetical protein
MGASELGPISSHVFVFHRTDNADWALQFAGDSAGAIFGARAQKPLSSLDNRRVAGRLRLIFDWVGDTGEAVSASFFSPDQTGEILAAPLGTDAKRIDGIFGGIVMRQIN